MARFSFKGWNLSAFISGRKEMIITIISAVLGYIATNNPAFAAICAALGECVFAVLDYYVKK